MNWNTSFTQGRDYTWLTTQSLTQLLESINYSYNPTGQFAALDIGCGSGQLARDLYHKGMSVTGIDTSEVAIELATQSTRREGISFKVHDVCEKQLMASFDLITCKYVIAFIEDKPTFLNHIGAMLKNQDSHAVFISPDPSQIPENKLDITVNTAEITQLLNSSFKTVSLQYNRGDVWFICRK